MGLPVAKPSPAPVERDRSLLLPRSTAGWSLIWTLAGLFVGGLALNLTPCVYPLIPITVSYFGGRRSRGKREVIKHGICYVGGLSLMNSSLGVMAALTGTMVGALLQSPLVLMLIAAVLVGFAASLFGAWEIRLPYWLGRAASKSYSGLFGSFFMGISLGVVAAPCIGPFVLGLLTWVAASGSPLMGFAVFFVLSLGLGTPLFLLALFSDRLAMLPAAGEWMLWVRRLFGWILVGMAAWFVQPVLPAAIRSYLLPAVLAAAGLHLGWIEKSKASFRAFPWIKVTLGIVLLVSAAFMAGNQFLKGPSVKWHRYSDRLLAEATIQKKPVVIDFTAAWCSPCRKMDRITFRHPDVVRLSQSELTFVKVDLTHSNGPIHDELLDRFEVKGVPTIVFLGADGKERNDLRQVDFIPPEDLLIRLADLW